MIRRSIGGWCWVAVVLILVAELITAIAWGGLGSYDRFDPLRITITDLGATGCAVPDSLYTNCSPLHPLLDLTLIGTGLLIIAGALLYDSDGRSVLFARVLFVVSGLLIAVQGMAPPWNAYGPKAPALAAGMTVGAVALILVAYARRPEGAARPTLFLLGLAGLIAGVTLLGLVAADPPRVLSRFGGLMERFAAYPVLAGLVLLGADRLRRRPGNSVAPTARATRH